jgi:hypothetical protein
VVPEVAKMCKHCSEGRLTSELLSILGILKNIVFSFNTHLTEFIFDTSLSPSEFAFV